mgnify:CR=1 FL=1
MKPLLASQLIATELVKNKAKTVVLNGSTARGKSNPNDLDIAVILENENPLSDDNYRTDVRKRLERDFKYKIDLFCYSEDYVLDLIEYYNKDSWDLCFRLNCICMDNVRDQTKGWPLVWIFGENAKKMLDPYMCYQEKFIVLEGRKYLDELRSRINIPV